MLNKKLVLGSLAGATLLVGAAMMVPATSQAGLLTGVCSNCHTMHDSQDGAIMATAGPNAQLLMVGGGCVGCHARTGADGTNDASGLGPAAPRAPQVGPDSAGTFMLYGGYFGDATDESQHNVEGVNSNIAGDANLASAPGSGGAFAVVNAAATTFTCEDCHGAASGGHHTANAPGLQDDGTTAATSYRLLAANENNDATLGTVFVASGTAPSATRVASVNPAGQYVATDAAGMNLFCAGCHPNFHGTANQQSAGTFVRHPTGVDVSAAFPAFTASATLPLGNSVADGSGTDVNMMCITCHRPHGSSQADLLRFTYADNTAGDTTVGNGCETCHGLK